MNQRGGKPMSNLRTIILALVAMLAAGLSSPARADSGFVTLSFVKAGWVIGGNVGQGTLTFRGRTYPVSVGGLSYGFTFGGSQTYLRGRVSNIWRPLNSSTAPFWLVRMIACGPRMMVAPAPAAP